MLIYGQNSMLEAFFEVFFQTFFFYYYYLVWFGHCQVVTVEYHGFGFFLADTVQSRSTLPLALSFGSNLFSSMKLSLQYNSSILYILCF